MPKLFLPAALLLLCCAAAPVSAQSGAALMIRPWQESRAVELSGEAMFGGRGHVEDGGDQGVQVRQYQGSGRFRFDVADEHSPAVGFDVLQIDVDSTSPKLPQRLADQSVGIGFGLAKMDAWEFGMTVGAGFAGDTPYKDSSAVYYLANFIASNKIDADTSLQIVLNYNGNRTFLPDVPLPGVAYHHKASESLTYTVGLPFTSVTWKPLEQVRIDASYAVPYTFDVEAAYTVVKGIDLFAGFHNEFVGFHVDNLTDHERLIFQQRRVEGGLRWVACDSFDLVVAGGWAFNQSFSFGFDARETKNDVDLSETPFVRVGVDLKF
jgi:hypothetical protein